MDFHSPPHLEAIQAEAEAFAAEHVTADVVEEELRTGDGVSRPLCSRSTSGSEHSGKLQLIFVGGLVPRKACDLALRAAAPAGRAIDGRAAVSLQRRGRRIERLPESGPGWALGL